MKHLINFNNFTATNEGSRWTLKDKLQELKERLRDLYSERREVMMEMESEAGAAGEEWSDDDGNRYGEELNRLDDEISRVKERIDKLMDRMDESYLDFSQAASVAQDTHGAQRYEYGNNPKQGELEFPEDNRFEEPEPDFTDRETFRKHMEDPKRKLDSIIGMAEMMKDMIKKNPSPYVTANLKDAYNSLRTAYLRTQDGF